MFFIFIFTFEVCSRYKNRNASFHYKSERIFDSTSIQYAMDLSYIKLFGRNIYSIELGKIYSITNMNTNMKS